MAWVALALFVGTILSATFAIYIEAGPEGQNRSRLPLVLWAVAIVLFALAIVTSPLIMPK